MDKICQSCGMPMDKEELFGANQDGTKNEEYCVYCFKDGGFAKDETMDEMAESCAEFMTKEGMSKEAALQIMKGLLPALKRWS